MAQETPEAAAALVGVWREAGRRLWFARDESFDQRLRESFAAVHLAAARGGCAAWEATAQGALALVLLLDQIPRNLYRGSARAYATDALALAAAARALDRGDDRAAELALRPFFHMPFSHAEDAPAQARAVALAERLGAEGGDPGGGWLKDARRHQDIIARFGRFPHRNAVLGRATTLQEQAFLDGGGFRG